MKKYKFVRKIVLGIMVLSLISGLLPASGFAEEELCGTVDGVYIGSWNGSDFVWKIDDKGGYSNTKGLWVSNRNLETTDENGVEKYGVFTITVNVESGKTYAYGFKAKADRASGVKVRVDWGASTSVLPLGNSFDWKNFEYRYTHTSAAASAKLRFTFSGSTKNMWFDDFYCYEVADGEFIGTNLVPNPDFDKSVSLATEKLKDEFSYEEYQNLSSVLPVYPVFRTDGKNIDGDMSDWENEKKMSFPVSDSQRTVKLTSKVPDNTADAYYAFDDEYLYILAAVEDDIHIPILDAATYWQGDSLQVALAKKEDTYGAEMGFALDEKTGDMLVTYRNGAPSEKLLAKGKREGTKTVYEIKIPWDIYFEKCPGEYKFSIAINDNDGSGRANMLEIAPGICTGKKSAEFPTFKNIEDENSFIAFADANSKAKGKEDNIINICVLNFGNDADFNISGEWFDEYSVKLKKNSGFKKSVVYNTAETGEKTIYANVLSNGKKVEIPVSLEVFPTDEMISEKLSEFKSRLSDIQKTKEELIKNGISTDYLDVDIFTAERFIEYIREDSENKYYDEMNYTIGCIDEILSGMETLCGDYLSGKKVSPYVPRLANTKTKVQGKNLIGTKNYNGEEKEEPAFLVGYGTFQDATGDWGNFESMGANLGDLAEISPATIISKPGYPSCWKFILSDKSNLSVSKESENPINGGNSLNITAEAGGSTFEQFVMLEPNTEYEYGMTVDTDKANSVRFVLAERDGSFAAAKYANAVGKRSYSNTFKTGAGYKRHAFIVMLDLKTDKTVIDNIYVKKKGDDKNLIKNGGFEYYTEPCAENSSLAVDYVYLEYVQDSLDRARRLNVPTVLGMTIHDFPTFVKVEYPEISAKYSPYAPVNFHHPKVREVLDIYYKNVLPVVNSYSDVITTVCYLNEPEFDTLVNREYFTPLYRDYIKEKYSGDIAYVNKIYSADYEDFDKLEMPKEYSPTAYYYDFKQFNDSIMIDFQKFITQNAKRYAPDLKIHYKTMVSNGYSEMKSFMGMGDVILEETSELSDIFGCDAYACYTRANQPVQGKMMAYRYMMSVADKPIINSEDHIMPDNFKNFDRKIAQFNAADIWNGAVYGRSQSILWLYARTYNTASYRYCALLQRPDCISKIGKASLDLQRLSNEVSALLNKKSDAAILFSETSRMYNLASMNTAYNIFTSLLNDGKKAEFISEKQIEKADDYKILFIPGSTHITDKTLEKIYSYSQNGGKVVIFNDESLKYNEQNILHDKNYVDEIYKNASVYKTETADTGIVLLSPSYEDFADIIRKSCNDAGLSEVKIINSGNGEIVKSAGIEMCEYDGGYIVNLTDYDWTDKNVSLFMDGKKIEKGYDLIACEEIKDGFTLKGYTPRLIKIEK